MSGDGPISRETFRDFKESNDKLNVLFDLVAENHECSCRTEKRMEKIEKSFERRKKVDSTLAGLMGLIGGVAAHIGQSILGLTGNKIP